jgi:quercetin dioxygenase-like cupin family protein
MSFFDIQDLKKAALAEGVEIRLISGDKLTMAFYSLDPEAVIPEHSHPHEQIGTVIKGNLELQIGGEKRVVDQGSAYIVPSNVKHSGRCLESPTELIETFSPPREDLIEKIQQA